MRNIEITTEYGNLVEFYDEGPAILMRVQNDDGKWLSVRLTKSTVSRMATILGAFSTLMADKDD